MLLAKRLPRRSSLVDSSLKAAPSVVLGAKLSGATPSWCRLTVALLVVSVRSVSDGKHEAQSSFELAAAGVRRSGR